MNIKVTIIIPTYKDWKRLSICLDALEKQTYPQEQFEIIVVNNDPEDSLPEGFMLSKNARLINEAKPGSYAARNAALNISNGNIIGFTDSDCIPDKDWIKNAVNFLEKNKDFARVAGPVQIIIKGKTPTVIERYNQMYSFPQKWLINNGGGSVTANLFVYKTVFNNIGGFDDTLYSMGDKFWGIKAEAAGYKIAYSKNVFVLHPPRNFKELIKKEKRHGGAIDNKNSDDSIKLYFNFLYNCLPKFSNFRFMFSRRKNLSIPDRIFIPILRQYLLAVREFESIKIRRNKKKPSRV